MIHAAATGPSRLLRMQGLETPGKKSQKSCSISLVPSHSMRMRDRTLTRPETREPSLCCAQANLAKQHLPSPVQAGSHDELFQEDLLRQLDIVDEEPGRAVLRPSFKGGCNMLTTLHSAGKEPLYTSPSTGGPNHWAHQMGSGSRTLGLLGISLSICPAK